MNNKKIILSITCFISIFFLTSSALSLSITSNTNQQNQSEYIDLTVEEAWNLLSDTSNGIQYPIDVRTDSEWINERIDTPYPEFPVHFENTDIFDEEGYQEFLDRFEGEEVIIYCKSGGRSASVASVLVSREFNGTVYNMLGGITDWKNSGYPTKTGNTQPETPDQASGPTICNLNSACTFSAQTTDSDEDPLRYGWDWNNDGLVDEWSSYVISGETVTISHTWNQLGTFNITVAAEDIVGSVSSFSTPLTVTINAVPSKPLIDGPSNGKAGKTYDFSFVSEDANGDEISYMIDWGDDTNTGWTRTLPSGEAYQTSHSWQEENTYTISVKAKDNYDGESEIATLQISMPKTRSFALIDYLISYFPGLEEILCFLF